jgi:CDP-glucose 4,6-dehydratase
METLLSFYRGKRVLVTGHTGFKGGWLASWLKSLGAEVTGVALAPETTPSLYELAGVGAGMTSEIADIRDRQRIAQIVSAADPEVVFHLAAQPLVRRSYADPIATYETNVVGTANVLDALRRSGSVRSIVVVTSDKCYENKEWEWGYRENDPLGGHDPYSSSKACTEIVAAAFRSSYFAGSLPTVGLATARAGNVIGGGDWSEDRIVPDIVRSISSDQPVVLRNPDAYRPWQHVLEPLYGYLLLGSRLWSEPERFAGAWNFGPTDDDTTTVGALASRIVEHWGRGQIEIRRPPNAVHEANALRLDSRKAMAQLGWYPVLQFDELIEMTVAWYETVLNNPTEAPSITQQQIADFVEQAQTRKTGRSTGTDAALLARR